MYECMWFEKNIKLIFFNVLISKKFKKNLKIILIH
jgi:hypothetical protein